jgi:hypothetical protein
MAAATGVWVEHHREAAGRQCRRHEPSAWAIRTSTEEARMPSTPRTARLMKGTGVAQKLLAETAQRAHDFTTQTGRRPLLAALLVGEDPASVTYVKMKRSRCEEVGVDSRLVTLPTKSSTGDADRRRPRAIEGPHGRWDPRPASAPFRDGRARGVRDNRPGERRRRCDDALLRVNGPWGVWFRILHSSRDRPAARRQRG